MKSSERGYIFQDYLSAYILLKYINDNLKNTNDIRFIFDVKDNKYDKYDDIKVIGKNFLNCYQVKYKEKSDILKLGDFLNPSGCFNLKDFILSVKNSENECRLFISMNEIEIEKSLIEYINEVNVDKTLKDSKTYKFKNLNQKLEKINNSNLSIKETIDNNDIEKFERNTVLEICRINIDDISYMLGSKIKNIVKDLCNYKERALTRILLDTVRQIRAQNDIKDIDINIIISSLFYEIGISKYLSPIDNEFVLNNDIFVSREEEVEDIIGLLNTNNIINIIGEPGVGKSWFTEELIKELKKHDYNITKYYFYMNNKVGDNLTERLDYNRFITTINYDLQRDKGIEISLINLDLNEIKNSINRCQSKHCIVLDGLDHILRENTGEHQINLKKLIDKLIEIFNDSQDIKIILLSQPIDIIQIDCKYTINRFNLDKVKTILDKYRKRIKLPIDLNEEYLYKKSGGNPLIIRYEIYRNKDNKNKLDNLEFENLNDYYKHIFKGLEYHIYSYFGILEFPVSKLELVEISEHSSTIIDNEIERISNILYKNQINEYEPFHESMKRYIKENADLKFRVSENQEKILKWLGKKNIYLHRKSFKFYPKMIIELNKYEFLNIDIKYNDFFDAVVQNGYTKSEIEEFLVSCSHIFMETKDFSNVYIISYIYDAYRNFMYEFDMENFEFYIYMLFYRSEKEKIINLINSKFEDDYSYQFREYSIKISKFLIDNDFHGIDYIEFMNKFKIHTPDSSRNNLYYFKNYKWSIQDGLSILFSVFRFYNIKLEDALNYIGKKSNKLDKYIMSFYNANNDNYMINSLYNKDIYVSKEEIPEGKFINYVMSSIDIKENDYMGIIFSFLSFTLIQQDKILSDWKKTFKDEHNFFLFVLSLIYTLTNDVSDVEIETHLNKFIDMDIQFKGLVNCEQSFICKLISLCEKKDKIIEILYNLINIHISKYNRHDYDGIRPYFQSLKNILVDLIIRYPSKSSINAIKLLNKETDEEISNSSNLIISLKNYCLYSATENVNNNLYEEVIKYMFTYGSYRDVQIWELEDFCYRLLKENMMSKYKLVEIINISLYAINIMDRAKDVHQVPNDIIEMCANKFPKETLEIILECMITFKGDFSDVDDTFTKIYDSIYINNNNKFNRYYNYWKYLKNTGSHDTKFRYEDVLNLVNLFYRKNEKNFIIEEFCDQLRSNIHPYEESKILTIKNALYKNDVETLKANSKAEMSYLKDTEIKDTLKVYKDIFSLIQENNNNSKDYEKLLELQIELLKKADSERIFDFFIKVDELHYTNNLINSIIKLNSEQLKKLNKKTIITYLVGLYCKTQKYISTMSYDELMDCAISIDEKIAKETLYLFIKNDSKYSPSMKAGKIVKYLVPDNQLEKLYQIMINLYMNRLPGINKLIRNVNITNCSQEEILFNYIMLNTFFNTSLPSIEMIIMIKIFNEFKIENILYAEMTRFGNYKDTGKYLLYLKQTFNNPSFLMYEAFLKNYGKKTKINFEVEYISNDRKNGFSYNINSYRKNINIYSTSPILQLEDVKDIINYECSYQHFFMSGMERDFLSLNKRIFYLYKRSFISKIIMFFKYRKYLKRRNK